MARKPAIATPPVDRMAAARAAKDAKRKAREAEEARLQTGGAIDEVDELTANRRSAVAGARQTVKAQRGAPARGVEREEVQRAPNGRVMARGRDGQMLYRKRLNTGDKFHIDPTEIPQGWSYQWVAVSVLSNSDRDLINTQGFSENGWTPVPSDRHPGQFMPMGHKGAIIRDGQMLMERPLPLTQEARAEEIQVANNLIRTQNDQFTPRLPNARAGQRGTGLQARRTVEPMPADVGRPNYEIAVDDGLLR